MRFSALLFALALLASGIALITFRFPLEDLASPWLGPILVGCGIILGAVAGAHRSKRARRSNRAERDESVTD